MLLRPPWAGTESASTSRAGPLSRWHCSPGLAISSLPAICRARGSRGHLRAIQARLHLPRQRHTNKIRTSIGHSTRADACWHACAQSPAGGRSTATVASSTLLPTDVLARCQLMSCHSYVPVAFSAWQGATCFASTAMLNSQHAVHLPYHPLRCLTSVGITIRPPSCPPAN